MGYESTKQPRGLRYQAHRAQNGEILTLAQLLQDHDQERISLNLDDYYPLAVNYLQSSTFKLKQIELKNIRRLRNFQIDLHPELTVIIGQNAMGKTTLCESIAKFLSHSASQIQKGRAGYRIRKEEITNDQSSAKISGSIALNEGQLCRYQIASAIDGDQVSDYQELTALSYLIRKLLRQDEVAVELPLFAYYGIERGKGLNRSKMIRDDIRVEAYEDALKEQTDISNLEEWFIAISNIDLSHSAVKINALKKQFNELLQAGSSIDPILLERFIDEIDRIEKSKDGASTINSEARAGKIKAILDRSIADFIEDFVQLFVDYPEGEPTLYLQFKGVEGEYKIQYNQLSHGQRSIINMVFDLIRRLVILNPEMEDPRLSRGIVVIDEIELHLHPKWQQKVIAYLRNCFPNIQWIITTHSPIVLQSHAVAQANISILREDEMGEVEAITPEVRGLSVNDILLDVFQVSVVEDNELSAKVRRLKSLINQGAIKEAEGRKLYQELCDIFGEKSHVLQEIDDLIQFQAFLK